MQLPIQLHHKHELHHHILSPTAAALTSSFNRTFENSVLPTRPGEIKVTLIGVPAAIVNDDDVGGANNDDDYVLTVLKCCNIIMMMVTVLTIMC